MTEPTFTTQYIGMPQCECQVCHQRHDCIRILTVSCDGKILAQLCAACYARGSLWAARQALPVDEPAIAEEAP